jgi:hypothetical protein
LEDVTGCEVGAGCGVDEADGGGAVKGSGGGETKGGRGCNRSTASRVGACIIAGAGCDAFTKREGAGVEVGLSTALSVCSAVNMLVEAGPEIKDGASAARTGTGPGRGKPRRD